MSIHCLDVHYVDELAQIVFRNVGKRGLVEVLVSHQAHAGTNAEAARDLNGQIEFYQAEIEDNTACGISWNGYVHPKSERCVNESWNEDDETHCPVAKIRELEAQQYRLVWAEEMLDSFWRSKFDTECLDFLHFSGFVYSYR